MPGSANTTLSQTPEDDVIRATIVDTCPYQGEIVVAGMSGRLPSSYNLQEFNDNLYNKVDLITPTDPRFPSRILDLPPDLGVIYNADRFDAGMFNFTREMTTATDPKMRMLLEATYEALADAGETMESVKGTRTGVFVGTLGFDYMETLTAERITGSSYVGNNMAFLSQWISHVFDLKGPSITLDSACSSSSMALSQAVLNIRRGHIDAAIVGGSTMVMDPQACKVIDLSSALSPDARCKTFDASANGYVRSEGNVIFYVTKESLAKRVYATVLSVRGNSDGYKPLSMASPSRAAQMRLMADVVDGAGIDRSLISLAEAHGTGTIAGDGQEADGIAEILCSVPRDKPLLISSVKSCVGHTEGAAGLASMCKVIFGMENELIPPNLHFNVPNPNIKCLNDGRVKVVAEPTPWKGQVLATVSAFGIGGSNYILCLRSNKNRTSIPHPASKVPRVVCYCARSEEAAERVLEEIRKHSESPEYQAMLQHSANVPVNKMPYRMYTILNSPSLKTEIRKCNEKRPLWWMFAGAGCQVINMGRDLMKIDLFRDVIKQCSDVTLSNYKMDLFKLISEGSSQILDEPTGATAYCATMAIQIGLVELLRAVGIVPDGIVGHSMGEVSGAYADGCQTLDECMRMAYWRGMAYKVGNVPQGKLLAVDLSWEEARAICPDGVYPACHNGWRNVTIGGPTEAMDKLAKDLEAKGMMAKEVNTYGYAHHTPCIKEVVHTYTAKLAKEWTPKKRSPKLLSTTFTDEELHQEKAQYTGLDYYNENVYRPVLFYETIQKIPENAIVLEINPTAIFENVVRKSMSSSVTYISVQSSKAKDNLEYFYQALGKLYTNGVDLNPMKLFSPVEFPVPRGTPMVGPTASHVWDHSDSWYVPHPYNDRVRRLKTDEALYEIDVYSEPHSYIQDNVVNGHTVLPEATYLYLLWRSLFSLTKIPLEKQTLRVSNVKFFRDVVVPPSGQTKVGVLIMKGQGGSGTFEIRENEELVATGIIFGADGSAVEPLATPTFQNQGADEEYLLSRKDIYTAFNFKGYNYGPTFQGLYNSSIDYTSAHVTWTGQWVPFINSLIQCNALAAGLKPQQRLTEIKALCIDPTALIGSQKGQAILCRSDTQLGVTAAGSAVVSGLKFAWSNSLSPQGVKSATTEFYKLRDESKVQISSDLKQYATACLKYVVHGFKKMVRLDKTGILPNKSILEKILAISGTGSQADLAKFSSDPNCTFAKYLVDMFALPFDKQFMENAKDLYFSMEEDLQNDKILSVVNSTESLLPALDICISNAGNKKINILEAGALESHLFPFVQQYCKSRGADVEYMAVDEAESKNGLGKAGVGFMTWDLSQPIIPEHKEKFDIILLKDELYKTANVSVALENVSKLMAPGGFLIVQEVTANYVLPMALGSFQKKVEAVEDKREAGNYLSRTGWNSVFGKNGFEVLLQQSDQLIATTFLLRKSTPVNLDAIKFINISDLDGNWIGEVQKAYNEIKNKEDDTVRLWLYASGTVNGAVGFIESFIAETNKRRSLVRGIIQTTSIGKDKKIDMITSGVQFKQIARMDLHLTEVRDGVIGCQIQRSSTPDQSSVQAPLAKAYLTMDEFGNLNTFKYKQRITPNDKTDSGNWASVYYAALNYHDALVATGQASLDTSSDPEGLDQGMIGTEFVGVDQTGNRIMGYAPKAIATEVNLDKAKYVKLPASVNMRDAGSMFMAYCVAFYSLVVKAKIRKGEKILIHSGTSCVSQAAIRIALDRQLTVFTTVSSDEKKAVLKETFPEIPDENITTRGKAFNHFMRLTGFKGVDITLNNLSGLSKDDGQNLLKPGGRYVELKKQSPHSASAKAMRTLTANASLIWVDIYQVLTNPRLARDREETLKLLREGLQSGVVKPIKTTVFEPQAIKEAFEFFNDRSHTGKILIKFREEESNSKPSPVIVTGLPRVWCDANKSYIIINGLESAGLELAEWLTERGAKKLVITGRTSAYTGYLARKLSIWEQHGVAVVVSTVSCATEGETKSVIEIANQLGPVDGVFYSPLISSSKPLLDLDPEQAKKDMASLASNVQHLDKLTRELCGKSMRWFVAFAASVKGSRVSGCTIQGFADSVAEAICTQRHADKLPALTIHRVQTSSDNKSAVPSYGWRLDQLETALLMSSAQKAA